MKVFTAYFAHETNSFSPIPTNIASFEELGVYRPSMGTPDGVDAPHNSQRLTGHDRLRRRTRRSCTHERIAHSFAKAAVSRRAEAAPVRAAEAAQGHHGRESRANQWGGRPVQVLKNLWSAATDAGLHKRRLRLPVAPLRRPQQCRNHTPAPSTRRRTRLTG